jgi:hypothetical protein
MHRSTAAIVVVTSGGETHYDDEKDAEQHRVAVVHFLRLVRQI